MSHRCIGLRYGMTALLFSLLLTGCAPDDGTAAPEDGIGAFCLNSSDCKTGLCCASNYTCQLCDQPVDGDQDSSPWEQDAADPNDPNDPATDAVDQDDAAVQCADLSQCADSLACNGVEQCIDNSCQAGTPLDCDDHIECTADLCLEPGGCVHSPVNDRCNDNLSCTVDSCDPTTGCRNLADHTLCANGWLCKPGDATHNEAGCVMAPECEKDADCDDGVFCNGVETCSAGGACVSGGGDPCKDTFACTTDSCNESTKSCQRVANDDFCDDNDVCNGVETCDPDAAAHNADGCVTTGGLDCDDHVGCTADSCHPVDGCRNVPSDASCNDEVGCTVDYCDSVTGCQHMVDVALCDDSVACTVDGCNAVTGCTHTPDNTRCADAFACTDETCHPEKGCQYTVHSERCNDEVLCTVDACVAGKGCVFTPDHTMCLQPKQCVPEFGGCAVPPECKVDADCVNADVCAGLLTCDGGFCTRGAPLNCDDSIDCTIDACDAVLGCQHTPDDNRCEDSNLCTSNTCHAQQGCLFPVTKDSDNDGHIDAACPGGTDCNDNTKNIHPGLTEICDNGIDDNCDNLIDAQDIPVCFSCNGGCAAGLACCNNACVDTTSDSANCAGCGKTCPSTQRCGAGVCRDKTHKCFTALDNLITAQKTVSFTIASSEKNIFNPKGSSNCNVNLPGPDMVWAFRKNANEPLTVEWHPPTDLDEEYLYVTTNCFDPVGTCVDDDYSGNWANVTLAAEAPAIVYYAIIDFDNTYPNYSGSHTLYFNYNDDGSCRSAGTLTGLGGLLLAGIVLLRALRRRFRAAR